MSEEPKHGKQEPEADSIRQEAAERAYQNKIVTALKRIAEQHKAADDQGKRADRFHRRVEKLTLRLEGKRYWLEIFGIAGIWTAAFVGIGAIWVATSDAGKQYSIFKGQLETAQKIMAGSERASLVVTGFFLRGWHTPIHPVDADLLVKNVGKIPGYVKEYSVVFTTVSPFTSALPLKAEYPETWVPQATVVVPNERDETAVPVKIAPTDERLTAIKFDDDGAVDAYRARISDAQDRLFAYGRIRYTDQYTDAIGTIINGFCFAYDPHVVRPGIDTQKFFVPCDGILGDYIYTRQERPEQKSGD